MLEEFIVFSQLLNERLSDGAYMSEDNVRYSFFLAAIQTGSRAHSEIFLEYPHPSLNRAQIDTYIQGDSCPRGVAIEFKYDRANPGGTNQNRTQRAGSFLADLFRLSIIPDEAAADKFFIYLTDQEMASYFKNKSNNLWDLYQLDHSECYPLGQSQVDLLAASATRVVEGLVHSCNVYGHYKKELLHGHELRIFRVQSAS